MNQCEEILTQIKKAFVGKKDVARNGSAGIPAWGRDLQPAVGR